MRKKESKKNHSEGKGTPSIRQTDRDKQIENRVEIIFLITEGTYEKEKKVSRERA